MTKNDQQGQGRGGSDTRADNRRRTGKSAVAFISGLTIATGAAAIIGAQVAHRTPGGSTPIVTASSFENGSTGTVLASGNGTSQVAQASSRDHTPSGGILSAAAAALSPRADDESLGTTADSHTFESVYGLVEDHYVDQLPGDTKMARGAVRTMIASLADPNSYFLEPDQRAIVEAANKGKFQGIGAITSIKGFKQPEGYIEYKIVVVDTIPGSPAQKAGLKSGDVITHVDDKWVLGSDPFLKANKLYEQLKDRDPDSEDAFRKEYESARKKALGGVGLLPTQIALQKGIGDKHTLTVQRTGSAASIKMDITTSETFVDPVSVKSDNKATIIKVSLLTDDAASKVKSAIASIPKGQGIVLDLRGNPGGVTSASIAPALQIKSALAQGRTFGIEIGHNGKKIALASTTGPAVVTRPIVVLVDRGTARSAEALAASLQDTGTATIVGGKTFGDAMARTLYSLRDGSGFVITTGKLLSAKGTDWQLAGGLTPQVALANGLPEEQVVARAVSVLLHHPQPVAANTSLSAPAPQP